MGEERRPTISEQIKVCEYALTFLVGPAKVAAMTAAIATLRKIQAAKYALVRKGELRMSDWSNE